MNPTSGSKLDHSTPCNLPSDQQNLPSSQSTKHITTLPHIMASTVMASPISLQLKLLSKSRINENQAPKTQPHSISSKPRTINSISLSPRTIAVAISSIISTTPSLPALAEQMEKAKLFDFNLTLPIIAIEFLLLMVALDKIYFTPLGKFMDERDAAIRAKLTDVKDVSEEVKQLEEQAAAVMRAARAEIAAALSQMKKETTAELEAKLAEGRKRVEAELDEALRNLEKQKEETIRALDAQIAELSEQIVKKVLPTK